MNWIDMYGKFKKPIEILNIKEPPCKVCRYFKPHRNYTTNGEYDGLTLCISEIMYKDFSCYLEKKKDNET